MSEQQLRNALEEKFYNERRLMQEDYSNRSYHYSVSQVCQKAMDKLDRGDDVQQVKQYVMNQLS